MIRLHCFIEDEQFLFLGHLKGKRSEHIRRAIDEYIQKLKSINASASQSKKGGENNGK